MTGNINSEISRQGAKASHKEQEGNKMEIRQNREGDKLTIEIEGRIDAVTAHDVGKVLEESLDGVKELIFDLKDLEYTSSAGLREFLGAQQIMEEQGSMLIRNVNETVMDIFEETGFDGILEIEK